jgi:hypothetical protein
MRKPTSNTQLAAFLFVDSRWQESHDAVQCRAHGSTFEFLFEFQTEFFSNFLFEFQVVQDLNRSTFEGPLYTHTHTHTHTHDEYSLHELFHYTFYPTVLYHIIYFTSKHWNVPRSLAPQSVY